MGAGGSPTNSGNHRPLGAKRLITRYGAGAGEAGRVSPIPPGHPEG